MAGQPKLTLSAASALLLVLTAWMASSPPAVADEAQARSLLKAMTDYVGAQQSIAFDYDATLEVVTKDRQKLQLASSGTVSLARPDKIRTTRSGGSWTSRPCSMARRSPCSARTRTSTRASKYRLAGQPGERTAKKIRPPPTRCRSVPHPCLRRDDGRRDGRQGPWQRGRRRRRCDYFAFRAKDVDWQIWVTQGARPRPCR